MVPLLLVLLLPHSLANQVCVNISDSDVTIDMKETVTLNVTDIDIVDERSGYVRCLADHFSCVFQCTFSRSINGSNVCFEVDVRIPDKVISTEQYDGCTLHLCKTTEILPLIHSLNSSSSGQKDMMKLFYIRDSCQWLFSSDVDVKEAFISVERQMIHNIMATSQLETKGSINYNLKALSLNVVNISEADLDSPNPRIQFEAPQLLPQNKSFIPDIWLPAYALRTIPKEKRIIGLVSYMQHSQFQFEQEEILSAVVMIELLGNRPLRNLKTPIKMTFRILPQTDVGNSSLKCHYFDKRDWKTDGCETISDKQTEVICKCNHATPFAVLLMRDPIAPVHWEVLSYISYIGCGLSAFFTALSLVTHVFSRIHRMDYSISIHVSLSGALFLLNSTFLLTEWGATVEPDWVCVFVAAFMHYSLLCCFTWMAIEALHLYLLLIKVFNTYFKRYLLKLSLAGWGIPGVIVSVSLGMRDFKTFYGVTQMTMAETNQTNAICWITDNSYFYSLNLVYFTLIFIFNTGILIAVASNICKMKRVLRSNSSVRAEAEGKKFSETCSSCLTVMGLTCLMGTTWGLAFLGSGYINYPILYLFCILNSTQGFFIFLWICLSAKKQRKKQMESRLTSGVKFD